jgi:iron(III) transport system ATP-binding protein
MPDLSVRGLVKTFQSVAAVAGVSFDIKEGECLVLLGPSGCGKTTTLRCVAGLEEPTDGEIAVGGQTVWSQAGKKIPAERRDIGLVFQSYALWPHMSIFDNVRYPLKVQGQSKTASRDRVMAALELVGLSSRATAYPAHLSGGQQQRVALARNIAMRPSVLLFDEPLSNLDADLRAEMRFELRRLIDQLGITAMYVTHDQAEAFSVADRIAVMNAGLVEQIAPPRDIYERPASRFVAKFVGNANVFAARVAQRGPGLSVYTSIRGGVSLASHISQPAEVSEVHVMIRPENVGVYPVGEESSGPVPPHTFVVRQMHYLGSRMALLVETATADPLALRVDMSSQQFAARFLGTGVVPGAEVSVRVEPEAVHVLPREGQPSPAAAAA